jgi:hypothetical protein
MGRYQFPAFNITNTPRYLVVWDLYWQALECRRLEPGSDLREAMTAIIAHLGGDGWAAESDPEYGFVFIRRANERRLLMLTPRDPYDSRSQSFDPFRFRL